MFRVLCVNEFARRNMFFLEEFDDLRMRRSIRQLFIKHAPHFLYVGLACTTTTTRHCAERRKQNDDAQSAECNGCIASDPTSELTRRRESKDPSPHQASYKTRSRRSRPTICWIRSRLEAAAIANSWIVRAVSSVK